MLRDAAGGTRERTENPCVPGSNPGLGTSTCKGLGQIDLTPFAFGSTRALQIFRIQLLPQYFLPMSVKAKRSN